MSDVTAWENFKATAVTELVVQTIKRAEINGLQFNEQIVRSEVARILPTVSDEARDVFDKAKVIRAKFLAAAELCKTIAHRLNYGSVGRNFFASEDLGRVPQLVKYLRQAATILATASNTRSRGPVARRLKAAAQLAIK